MKKTIPISGMHCQACEIAIADELEKLPGVESVNVSPKRRSATITADVMPEKIDIARAVKRAGYKVGVATLPLFSRNVTDYQISFFVVLATLVILLLVSNFGVGFDFSAFNPGLWLPLLIGLAAGFSTCIALVGGIVAGLSAKHIEANPTSTRMQNFQPHIAFNLGRIGGFMVLGAGLGWIGSAITFSPLVTGILTIIAAFAMLFIGLQLTGIFPKLTVLALPSKFSKKLGLKRLRNKSYSHVGAAIVGGLSFFLPCGFTQAMQLSAAASGSWSDGALIMGLFALGTTPGLLLVGGLTAILKGKAAKIAFKVLGSVIVVLALASVTSGLRMSGVQLSNGANGDVSTGQTIHESGSEIKLYYTGGSDFTTDSVKVKSGGNYKLKIYSYTSGVGCMSAVMLPGLSDQPPQLLIAGDTVNVDFNAKSPGQYELVCAMGLPFNFKIIVE